MDQYDGTNVVLLGNSTEGTNRLNAKDGEGSLFIQAIIKAGKQSDGGFTDYVYPKEKQKILQSVLTARRLLRLNG